MELYTATSYQLAERLTKRYSTSFSLSSRLFSSDIRPHIYAIYGLVRIADEIVDTYRGKDAQRQLNRLHKDTLAAIKNGYSTNPIIQAFADTAARFSITDELIAPFFASMAMDLNTILFTKKSYRQYIYGSAEVVGLMCLKVFVPDEATYETLRPGAQALGSAYQKVNFLRDMRTDYSELGRVYFPGVTFETFNEKQKADIIKDIQSDFDASVGSLWQLPASAQKAVLASYLYYCALLDKLARSSVDTIKHSRVRVPNSQKLYLYIKVKLGVLILNDVQ